MDQNLLPRNNATTSYKKKFTRNKIRKRRDFPRFSLSPLFFSFSLPCLCQQHLLRFLFHTRNEKKRERKERKKKQFFSFFLTHQKSSPPSSCSLFKLRNCLLILFRHVCSKTTTTSYYGAKSNRCLFTKKASSISLSLCCLAP